jgi:hypothetical protein
VRRQLLARGSLTEAARSTLELLLLRLDDLRFKAAGELATALAAAFGPVADGLAAEIARLAGLAAADQPLAYHQARQDLTRSLRHQAPASPAGRRCCGRPAGSPTGCCAGARSSRIRSAPRPVCRRAGRGRGSLAGLLRAVRPSRAAAFFAGDRRARKRLPRTATGGRVSDGRAVADVAPELFQPFRRPMGFVLRRPGVATAAALDALRAAADTRRSAREMFLAGPAGGSWLRFRGSVPAGVDRSGV